MELNQKIEMLVALGSWIENRPPKLQQAMIDAQKKNPWFTANEIDFALNAISGKMLNRSSLESWLSSYLIDNSEIRTIGLILAGNIPLVGFHDVLCVFLSGHRASIKYSEKDEVLIPCLLEQLKHWAPEAGDILKRADKLSGFDAVIATGSDTSGQYFQQYFGKYPHIIRSHRNSIAVLSGKERPEDLVALGEDVYRYFGLGCRNVSKIFVPFGYDLRKLLESWEVYKERIYHHKYKNNFEYNYALYLLNKEKFLHNDSILLKEDPSIYSRIASVHYEYYLDLESLQKRIASEADQIQCVIAQGLALENMEVQNFGAAQCPGPDAYADGIDTMKFLLEL